MPLDAHKLIPVKMKKDDMQLADVQAFRCGSKPHEKPLEEWIKRHSAEHIASGYRVWLYRLGRNDGPLVGYGSLSTDKIKITEQDGSEREVKVYEIPMLALHEEYWGKPKGVSDPEEKYSRQIIRHLQHEAQEAQKRGQRERFLTLYVHPDATLAQDLYLACGFTFAPSRFLSSPDIPPEKARGFLGMDYVW
jgi:ribosomal protein S18 acetylase RimI-like enzyme